jgi:hypothetical protein
MVSCESTNSAIYSSLVEEHDQSDISAYLIPHESKWVEIGTV